MILKVIIIVLLSAIFVTLLLSTFYFVSVWRHYLESKNELLAREIKNKKYELFNDINITTVKEIVDAFIEEYINRYVTYKFIANNVMYIREQDQEEMIRNVTRNIVLDISELYVYYIELLVSIENDQDLVKFINTKVKSSTISFCANYNQARNETNVRIL